MSTWSLRKKEYLTLVGLTLLAVLLGSAVIVWGATVRFITPDSIAADNYVAYNMQDLEVKKDNTSQGLPVYDVSFNYGDEDNREPSEVTSTGFSLLGETLSNLIKEEPVVYNIYGNPATSNGSSFTFTSSSPSDYTNEVYSKAYNSFIRISDLSAVDRIQYNSAVQPNGDRFVTVTTTVDSRGSDSFTLQNTWKSIIQNLAVTDLTTYKVIMKQEDSIEAEGVFTTAAERDNFLNVNPSLWNTADAYTKENSPYATFGVVKTKVSFSPAGNNQTTVMVTVNPPANRSEFVSKFNEAASKDATVAWITDFTTVFLAEGETTPFFIQYPSNREW